MKLFVILGMLSLMASWVATPYVIMSFSGDCVASTVLIYEEFDKVVVSKGSRYTFPGSNEHYYTAYFEIRQVGMPVEYFRVERTIETSRLFNIDSFNIRTAEAFRIAGPTTDDPRVGRYIEPLAEKGFNARVYHFKAGENSGLVGFRGLPLNICQR
ncbi:MULTISPECIES: hypothetical protein [unclassified Pantoea]|uniref:hypothetical protein n=1 Tax=unclassified Pantoea TaxID=2630326 RepID=UPI0011BEEA55|nr:MULTISPECIES: hypothetical protein [unclassified Pantoea]KAA6050456.1 hypothetical protein F3I35_00190 [Pantoea sp. Bo_7]KAA6094807.1 hypothetical protein F3I22_00190 [Pantoea sp. Bo_10]